MDWIMLHTMDCCMLIVFQTPKHHSFLSGNEKYGGEMWGLLSPIQFPHNIWGWFHSDSTNIWYQNDAPLFSKKWGSRILAAHVFRNYHLPSLIKNRDWIWHACHRSMQQILPLRLALSQNVLRKIADNDCCKCNNEVENLMHISYNCCTVCIWQQQHSISFCLWCDQPLFGSLSYCHVLLPRHKNHELYKWMCGSLS